jgi:integrase
MARKKKESRIYTRNQGGAVRFYGDFRNIGGGREALAPKGEKLATTDPDIAAKLAADRVKQLEENRRNKTLLGVERQSGLKAYAAYHLRRKAQDKEGVRSWLVQSEKHLRAAVDFFGAETDLASITPEGLTGWVDVLRRTDNGRGGTLGETSVRKYLNSLSNLYKRAWSELYVTSNPVANMFRKPTESRGEAPFLEAHEAALLLESARTYKAPGDGAFPWMYPLLATFLLTGGRKNEVLGLEVDDLSLRHDKIYLRPNQWRRLKTAGSKRSLPLWPQLKEILSEYLMERERTGGLGALLFPSGRGSEEKMIRDVRKALDHIGHRAGFPKGYIRLHMLRHTYASQRVQTCDRRRPVALYTVARELGHKSTDMLEDRYLHLHDRTEEGGTEVVEFRVENHRVVLQERLEEMANGS